MDTIKKIKPKQLALALIIGLALTLLTFMIQWQTTIEESVSNCSDREWSACYSDFDSEKAKARGFPFYITATTRENTDYEHVYFYGKGALGDWLLYSTLAYIPIMLRRSKTKKA